MASRWGRVFLGSSIILFALPHAIDPPLTAHAAATSPAEPVVPEDPAGRSAVLEQGYFTRILDTRAPIAGGIDGVTYVNDHTFVQSKTDGSWHLFGIYHREPFDPYNEVDFIHAVAKEPDPAKWREGEFVPAAAPYTIALRARKDLGETHVWAPHVVDAGNGRYVMAYQGGGDRDRASFRIAESTDLYRWDRISQVLFEDICDARDPMLVRRDDAWALYYTRCESSTKRVSGVAYRQSSDLVHWTEPRMALLSDSPELANSGYTESPFVFERDGHHFLSVTSYPRGWDTTLLYRSLAPFAFGSAPFARLRSHAGEWVESANGKHVYLTHSGPGQGGIWMSEITGFDP